MNSASDRRAPGATRIPFDGMVEVGGALGPSFEAQAVNLSEEGMHLRTAYLPEIGQPITCRFDAGQGLTVVAAGEVLWKDENGEGGEFGIRFTNLDGHSTVALQRIMGLAEDGILPRAPQGRRVRLHIEGLQSPMRARIRNTDATCATAYSDLGFLEMGKPLALEDAMNGDRRPAVIDRVDVAMESGSKIPQLVMTLRFDDEQARMAMAAEPQGGSLSAVTVEEQTGREAEAPMMEEMEEPSPDQEPAMAAPEAPMEAKTIASESEGLDEDSEKMKGTFARTAAKITPAMTQLASRAKTTFALLAAKIAAKRGGSGDDVEIPMRRTTAPAPSGGLHAAGRKVFRGEIGEDSAAEDEAPKSKLKITKRRAAIGGALFLATTLAFFAARKPAPAPQLAAVPPPDSTMVAPPAPAPAPVNTAGMNAGLGDPMGQNGSVSGMMSTGKGKNGKPAPFTNGVVGNHGNVIKMKMDGQIDVIEGASQPTGFTVLIPHRKSMDAAGPLASKDPRIASLRVTNENEGAQLEVTFKDGVPNYAVRAKGDTLEIALQKPNANGDKPAEAKAGGHKKPHKKH